ncbi:hypothetical protein HMPREF3199_01022, partial [Enterococcus faecium]
NQRPDLSIREINGKIAPHIFPFFELIPKETATRLLLQSLFCLLSNVG